MKRNILLVTVLLIAFAISNFACGGVSDRNINNPNINSSDNSDASASDKDKKNATDEKEFLFREDCGYIVITGLKSQTEQNIIIPETIDGKPVREISNGAFRGNKNLKSLTVTEKVERIGYGILSECANLTSLTLPFTGERHKTERSANDYNFGYIFGEQAYNGGISTMQFYHKSMADNVELVYYYIPSTLKEVKITGVNGTHIPYGAFYNCDSIEKITLGENIISVGAFAFSGVTGEITWENPKITTIGEHSFEDFKGQELIIPGSVTEIKKSGYSACIGVKRFVIPDSVKKIDIYAFSYCYDLESVKLGKDIEKLPAETFYFCINLKTVELNDALKVIEDGAFDSCKALAAIEIPKNVTRINANAFKNCEKLKSVGFSDANGWRYFSTVTSGDYFSATELSDKSKAAKYITETFRDFIWEKTPQ